MGTSVLVKRTITSHSERAAAIERGLFMNRLSGTASQVRFLFELLQRGIAPDRLAPAMSVARELASSLNRLANEPEVSSSNYVSLIPHLVWDDGIRALGDLEDLPTELDKLLDEIEEGTLPGDERIQSLAEQLDRLSVFLENGIREVRNHSKR